MGLKRGMSKKRHGLAVRGVLSIRGLNCNGAFGYSIVSRGWLPP